MFLGWQDYPPTNILVKALVQGFGGWAPAKDALAEPSGDQVSDAMAAMRESVLSNISIKAGRSIPIIRGRDKDLPKAAPVFDLDAMRQRNEAAVAKMRARRPADG